VRILGAAEDLFIEDFESRSEKAKKKAWSGKKNIVEIHVPSFRDRRKYHRQLEEDPQAIPNKFTSPLLRAFCKIKENCYSLQCLSLYLSTLQFPEIHRIQTESPTFIENPNFTTKEVSTLDKLKQFELFSTPDDLDLINLEKVLSNKNLEIFKLKLDPKPNTESKLVWGDRFAKATTKQIKELSIWVSQRAEIPLFGDKSVDYIQRLDCLEAVEFVNENFKMVTFDFLYGFVTNVLEKRSMRRILICTKVVSQFYSEQFGKFLSKSLETQLKKILSEVSQDWEERVKVLKGLRLEEIFVEKLSGGYGFDYLLFNKEMEVTDKLF